MSYETDTIEALVYAIRQLDGLKYAIKDLNRNIEVFINLTNAINNHNKLLTRQLELEEIRLGINNKKNNNVIPTVEAENVNCRILKKENT